MLKNLGKPNLDVRLIALRQGFAPDYPGRPIVKDGKFTSNVIGNLKAGMFAATLVACAVLR